MRTAQAGDIFVLLTPSPPLTEVDFPWQATWQKTYGGKCTNPLHVSLQRFTCPTEMALTQIISTLHTATATIRPVPLTGVDIRPLYSAFRESYILKCRVKRDEPLETLDALVRQTVLVKGLRPHYRRLAVLITVLEGIAEPQSLVPLPLPEPMPLFTGSRMVISRVTGQEAYEELAAWRFSA